MDEINTKRKMKLRYYDVELNTANNKREYIYICDEFAENIIILNPREVRKLRSFLKGI